MRHLGARGVPNGVSCSIRRPPCRHASAHSIRRRCIFRSRPGAQPRNLVRGDRGALCSMHALAQAGHAAMHARICGDQAPTRVPAHGLFPGDCGRADGCSQPPHLSLSTAMAAKSSPALPGSVRAPRCAGRWPSRADHRCIDTERGAGRHCSCRFMGHGERHADSVHGSDRNAAPNHGNYVKREDVTPVDRGSIVVVRMRRVLRLLRSDGSFLGMHVGNACLGFIACLLQ